MQVLGRRKKIRVNTYRAKKKENQSESEKNTQFEKRDLENRNIQSLKKQKQMLDNNNMEAVAFINIANTYKSP